jgi:hypothetical protein
MSIQKDLWVVPPYAESQCLVSRTPQLSADPNIWPYAPGVAELLQDNIGSLSNPLGLAIDFDLLLENCKACRIDTNRTTGVALTCFEANLIALNDQYGTGWFNSTQTESELINCGWSLAGFDTLDLRGLISGLSGCGYKSTTKHELKAYFSKKINKTGLFSTNSWAEKFANVRGLQIPQHAPFIPVGVWIIPNNNNQSA